MRLYASACPYPLLCEESGLSERSGGVRGCLPVSGRVRIRHERFMGPRCPGCPGVFALSRSWCVLGRPGCLGVIGLSNVLGRPGAPRTPQDLTLETPPRPRTKDFTLHNARGCACVGQRHSKRPPDKPKGSPDDPRGSPDNPEGSPDNPRGSQTVCGRPLSVTL